MNLEYQMENPIENKMALQFDDSVNPLMNY